MTTTTKPRCRLPPATGTCLWLDDAPNGNRRLEITTATSKGTESHIYEVAECPDGGYLLLRVDLRTGDLLRYRVKHLTRNLWTCDCPDATNRPERRCACKHARALPAALRRLPF